ncbi:MAG: thiol peroxidase [Cytophagales bacterium]|nr:thiol peroxidase [Armatimonadota bacterium]
MAEERSGVVTFMGGPMTLAGTELKEGDAAPEATLTNGDLAPVRLLGDAAGKAKLVITVPSVDTSVCSLESKKFSDAVKTLDAANIAVYVVSNDLPFAQKRWCVAEGVDNLTLLSDYRDMNLAHKWGLLVKEIDLFARAVYVLDEDNKVVYREIVSEIANEPNYDAAIRAVKSTSA